MDKKQHIEAIEARRPDSNDLSNFPETERAIQQDDELRALANYVAETDKCLSQLMHAVEVPEGLVERLHLALQSNAALEPTARPITPLPTARPKSVRKHSRAMSGRLPRLSRRQWTSLAVGLSLCAACLIMATSYALRSWNAVGIDQLVAAYSEADAQLADWRPFSIDLMKNGYRFPQKDLVAVPIRWQEVSTSLDSTTQVMYFGPNAKMLVVKARSARDLARKPLDQIYKQTGGIIYTAWSDNGLIYLVAVKGTEDSLRNIFPSAPPVAFYRMPLSNLRQSA